MIVRLDSEMKARKQKVSEEISIKEIKDKKNEWFLEVERLGNITQNAYQFKDIAESLKYFDEKTL